MRPVSLVVLALLSIYLGCTVLFSSSPETHQTGHNMTFSIDRACSGKQVTILVTNLDGDRLGSATVMVYYNGSKVTHEQTGLAGTVRFIPEMEGTYEVKVVKHKYLSINKTIEIFVCLECLSDSECYLDQYCGNNYCVDKKLEGENCSEDRECMTDACENQVCVIEDKAEAKRAIQDTEAAINLAKEECKSIKDAETRLKEAQDLLDSCDYVGAKKLANEATNLAESAKRHMELTITPKKPKIAEDITIKVTSCGKVVGGAKISIDEKIYTTDANGEITFIPDRIGTVMISASKKNYITASRSISIAPRGLMGKINWVKDNWLWFASIALIIFVGIILILIRRPEEELVIGGEGK